MPKHSSPTGLTFKQERFVAEYLVDGNAKRAAEAAGYSARTAVRIGSENLAKPEIKRAIAAALKAQQKRTLITADQVLRDIERIAAKAEGAGEFNAALRGKELLGKHYKLFTEKHEHGGIGGGPVVLQLAATDEKL